MESQLLKRISFTGPVEAIGREVCALYALGSLQSCSLVEVGYEDCNFLLKATGGSCFVKALAGWRTDSACQSYVEKIAAAGEAGVVTPRLLRSPQGLLSEVAVEGTKLRLCAMEKIQGQDLYRSPLAIGAGQIDFLARQAALISTITLDPPALYDSWAIINFEREFATKGACLSAPDRELVEPLLPEFRRLEVDKLPRSFVHGDIISTNLMADRAKKLWIIDFSVARRYPRIQELAVLACDLLFEAASASQTAANIRRLLFAYQQHVPLTARELEALPSYIQLAHGMHVLCANYEAVAAGNSSRENSYWLMRGRGGLLQGPPSL